MQFHYSDGLRSALIAFVVCATIAACAPTRPDGMDNSPLARQANAEELRGDHATAADLWQKLANQLDGNERDQILLRAAKSHKMAGQFEQARRALAEIENPPVGESGIDFQLLSAELALASGDPRSALETLAALPPELSDPDKAKALKIESDARFALGETGAAVNAAVDMAAYLSANRDIDDNRRRIWNRLQEASTAGADMSTPPDANQIVAGWMELGRILELQGGNSFGLKTSLGDWRERNPLHPASRSVIDGVLTAYGNLSESPKQVALILPLSGRVESSAEAVRDGFLAAYFEQKDDATRPTVRIYDSSALSPVGAWERAAQEGADFIVGPLLKDEVEKISGVSGGVTTLVLNEPVDPDSLPTEVYQFALSPEDEARQVAVRVLDDKLYRGLALVPANDWGMRIAESLGETLQAGGGRLVELATYAPGNADYSDTITGVLRVDQSKSRRKRVEQVTGLSLKFEPRRRQDIDFVFLAALPHDGRLLRPQLRFHRAADLPIYATSAIFETRNTGNRDLDGLIFNDMPWILGGDETMQTIRRQIAGVWPTLSTRRARLFALGFDAYQLAPLIRTDRSALIRGVDGMTGILTFQDGRRIQRNLDWATVIRGEPSVQQAMTSP